MPQPFYHRIEILFTATADVSAIMDDKSFLRALERFVQKEIKKYDGFFAVKIVKGCIEYDAPCTAEPGDPQDLP